MNAKETTYIKAPKFLVTGGAGFIGSHLCEALVLKGYSVWCIDNLSSGKMKNIEHLIKHEKFKFIIGDITDFNFCLNNTQDIDYVLHQAAWGSVPRSIEMPLEYEKNNILGTLNMLEASRINNVKRFIYASSSSVYGDSEILPKVEGNEGKPLSPYALTKSINEQYAKLFYDLYGLETIGLRYFNVFGPRQDPNGFYAAVIPKFITTLLNNKQPLVNGNGEQSRDFTYVKNVVEANIKACFSDKKSIGKAYNIAVGERFSINQIVEIIKSYLEVEISPIYGLQRKGDILHSFANINSAKSLLGYNPEWDFRRAITETIEWYKNET